MLTLDAIADLHRPCTYPTSVSIQCGPLLPEGGVGPSTVRTGAFVTMCKACWVDWPCTVARFAQEREALKAEVERLSGGCPPDVRPTSGEQEVSHAG